jgi:hypothetical protein
MDDLTVNLKSVSLVRVFERLVVVDDRFLIVDCRRFQPVIRWITGDSRKETLEFLEKILDRLTKLLSANETSPRQRNELVLLLPGFRGGLDRMKVTYSNDHISVLTLENLCASVDTLLREHVFSSRQRAS